MSLEAADFAAFFRAVHGVKPFPWQQALVERLAAGDDWPDVLDLPTAAGKTAALDAAVFHLALRSDKPRKAALRIALVVDRRLVVDDAFARARKLADALAAAGTSEGGALADVARRLRKLAGREGKPLLARRLRGGAPLEHDWARTPTQPTILCSTVDQAGSRLLFRGYGVSDRMKPVHAGLLGTDSLILLDEAHLSEPFRQTLEAVRQFGKARVKCAVLSATPGAPPKTPLALASADRAHPILKARLEASKPARLTVRKAQGAAKAFADAARDMAAELRRRGTRNPAVGVVVNRIRLARAIFDDIAPAEDDDFHAVLMIGRSRPFDRDAVADKLKPFRTGSGKRCDAAPLFIVATQCLEVGVDIDLDGLVSQAASLDALRQRFGRLNRDGRDAPAEGAIIALSDDIAKRADDPVYGDRIRLTWETLAGLAGDKGVDFGISALEEALKAHDIDAADLAAPRENAPTIMPAYLDLWSHTSPRPTADPEVGLFLHGAARAPADVSIVWRSDIDFLEENGVEDSVRRDVIGKLMELAPPRATEMAVVPLWAARNWLRGGTADAAADIADVPERESEDPPAGRAGARWAFRWAGRGDPRTGTVRAGDVRPDDILIVPARYGGCDEFGWNPGDGRPVKDIADEAAKPYRGRRAFARVARDMVADDDDSRWNRIAESLADEGVAAGERLDAVLSALQGDSESSPRRDGREALKALRPKGRRLVIEFPYGDRSNGAVFVAPNGLDDGGADPDDGAPATEHDEFSHAAGAPVLLNDHGNRVRRFAGEFAEALCRDNDIAKDLRLAACLHDAGKADERFQLMLSGGNPWNRPDNGLLAKSRNLSPPNAWARSGLPAGWRHEALSVRMARAHPAFAQAHDPALVLWLIGSHHGFGRPFYGFADPDADEAHGKLPSCLGADTWSSMAGKAGPESPCFDFDGMGWPELFVSLKRHYGIWGLAHLEAVLRLADHRASEEEAGKKGGKR